MLGVFFYSQVDNVKLKVDLVYMVFHYERMYLLLLAGCMWYYQMLSHKVVAKLF